MSGRDHLSGDQFQLFDDEEYYLPAPTGPRVEEDKYAGEWDRWDGGMSGYTSAHDMPGRWTRNPLYDDRVPQSSADWGPPPPYVDVEEFIPLEHVRSHQEYINEDAVQHQLQHANPLALGADPSVKAIPSKSPEEYVVFDGNHRLNAALRRGQLLHPAVVTRGAGKG